LPPPSYDGRSCIDAIDPARCRHRPAPCGRGAKHGGVPVSDPDLDVLRRHMVAQIAAQTIFLTARLGKASLDRRVLEVMGRIPRHDFVRLELRPLAYADMPLPSGYGKTISQPFIVALMTDLLDLQATDSVLEIGTGLGYQTAILAALAKHVYSVELIDELAIGARQRLVRHGCTNVSLRIGDGNAGWREHAPFDKIIVTAAPDVVPKALIDQLKPGGRLVIPAGMTDAQQLLLVQKRADQTTTTKEVLPVRFSRLEQADED
jgi:protein-L-isoaspartate(D-aspartate) O-methyltransferase